MRLLLDEQNQSTDTNEEACVANQWRHENARRSLPQNAEIACFAKCHGRIRSFSV